MEKNNLLWFDLIHLYCNLQQHKQFNRPCHSDWNSGGRDKVEVSGVTAPRCNMSLLSNRKSLLHSCTRTALKVFYYYYFKLFKKVIKKLSLNQAM